MRKTWIIAKHEFIVTVRRKGYLLVLFGMPLLFGGIIGVSLFSSGVFGERRLQFRSDRSGRSVWSHRFQSRERFGYRGGQECSRRQSAGKATPGEKF